MLVMCFTNNLRKLILGLFRKLKKCSTKTNIVVLVFLFSLVFCFHNKKSFRKEFNRKSVRVYKSQQNVKQNYTELINRRAIELNKYIEETSWRNKFRVYSPSCKIPGLDAYNISEYHRINSEKQINCAFLPPLTKITFRASTKQHYLEIDASAMIHYSKKETVKCCVSRIYGYSPPKIDKCKEFYYEVALNGEHEFVSVMCYDSNTIVYHNLHGAVGKIKNKQIRSQDLNKPNVLLIGMDSISRMNLLVNMPGTVAFLQEHDWVDMKGYNAIGESSLRTLMTILTGMAPDNFKFPHRIAFDNYPFIWNNFSSAGYVTAFSEDVLWMNAFDSSIKSFTDKPTDHYTRTLFQAGAQFFRMGDNCLGLKSYWEHLFEYLQHFTEAYKDHLFFGVFWINSFIHNRFNIQPTGDDEIVNLLRYLQASGTMNTSIVIFFSDYGATTGEHKKTRIGWYEDRLPFLYISLPEDYIRDQPVHYLNLLKGANTLTSPFDVHMTLRHVLLGYSPPPPQGCGTCRSLLDRPGPDRSCADAGLSPHWCACKGSTYLTFEKSLNHYAVVTAINRILVENEDIDRGYKCETIDLKQTLYVRKKTNTVSKEYVIAVETNPGGLEYEATVVETSSAITVDNDISRISKLPENSQCVKNPVTRIHCFCTKVV